MKQLTELCSPAEGETVEQAVTGSAWAAAFLSSPGVAVEPSLTETFLYAVHCAVLQRTPPARSAAIIAATRQRFFSDRDFGQPSVAFADPHGVVAAVFASWEEVERPVPTALRAKLLLLAEDEAVRALDAPFAAFIIDTSLHPTSSRVQQCLLSLL